MRGQRGAGRAANAPARGLPGRSSLLESRREVTDHSARFSSARARHVEAGWSFRVEPPRGGLESLRNVRTAGRHLLVRACVTLTFAHRAAPSLRAVNATSESTPVDGRTETNGILMNIGDLDTRVVQNRLLWLTQAG